MGRRDLRLCGKATPAFLTWLKSAGSKRLLNRKTDDTYAATFLWAKRSGSRRFIQRLMPRWTGLLPVALAGAAACLLALAAAEPHIETIELTTYKAILIHFGTDANRKYVLQYLDVLSSTNWVDLFVVDAIPFPNHYVILDSITNSPVRIYRLAVSP